jgi:hypothetical protein
LLPDFKIALGLPAASDPQHDPLLEEFIAQVVLGAAWYQGRYLRARWKVWFYIVLNCLAVIGLPIALVGLWSLSQSVFKLTGITGQITSQITAMLTGVLGLQKTLATWYASQQRYATWYKSASDLKTIYYTFVQSWAGRATADPPGFTVALSTGISAARKVISDEQLDFYQKLTLPSFDILDLLTSGGATVSTLVTSLLPGTPPVSVSAVGKNILLSRPPVAPSRADTGGPAGPQPGSGTPKPMFFSRHSLHRPVMFSSEHKAMIEKRFASIINQMSLIRPRVAPSPGTLAIPLTTVSLDTDFDAYINVLFTGSDPKSPVSLLLDSGNATLIVPRWEDIAALPNSASNYTLLGTGKEPWGCPANIVRGPIHLATGGGGLYTIENCVFYACTGDGDDGTRTANFGAACISPWTASGWNTPAGIGVTMQAPLSYNPSYQFAEFNYEAGANIFGSTGTPNVSSGSSLVLYQTQPPGYTMCDIIRNLAWMALTPKSLAIGTANTPWPGATPSPIAMIDTGGGPVYLSDPDGYVYSGSWPDPVANPCWASSSTNCQSTSDAISIELTDAANSIKYTIDPSRLPAAAQGLTLVMCQTNAYMMGQNGMNIGGISALANFILVDYGTSRVGLRPK